MDSVRTGLHMNVANKFPAIGKSPFNENFFVQVFESMRNGVAYGKVLHHNRKPYDFIFLYVNPAFQKHIGRKDIDGRRATELFPDIYESGSESFCRKVLSPIGSTPTFFKIFIKSLNEWFSVQMSIPKEEHCFFIFENITRRILIEKNFNRLMAEKNAILDNHIVGIAKIRDRKFIWVNNAFENLLGYTPNELVGQSTRICYRSDEDYIEAGESAARALNGSQVYRAEVQLVAKDGSLHWFAFHAELLEPLKTDFLVMLIDITQKKEADIKLLAASKELEDLYENAPCGYHSIDENGVFQKINATELSWLGVTREEVIGKLKPTDFFNAEGKEVFLQKFPQLKQAGHVENIQMHLVPKSGATRQVSVSASIVKDDSGNFVSTRTVMHDVTEVKKMEECVRQYAFYDALTNLPNRYLFEDRLNQALSASERSHCYGALLFIDLDDFKPLNDIHGHSVGDLLLIEAAKRLKKCVREIDTVARFGGDEFVIIITKLSVDMADSVRSVMKVAKKINRFLRKPYRLTQEQEGGLNFCVQHVCSASIGMSLFVDNTITQSELLKQADRAMYSAKKGGKNSVRLYSEKLINERLTKNSNG